ncbi:hypothetical protein OG765_37670 [Streptomyces sp. NBC_00555]|uniref:hypothetical protein n=1 Tax=Streptomyces sp. NBC_00555 TaxID=2903662 RepID=UPI0022532332|nr:hypothetical protein [Streptomyces sp. NBC_00555]MCX5016654.1 hypothetical protein [Streptomyces sp. NBC_00555]
MDGTERDIGSVRDAWGFGRVVKERRTLSTWRHLLAEASHWGEYRGALRALQKETGLPFAEMSDRSMQIAARGLPGIRYCSVGTLNTLAKTELSSLPKWYQIEVFVRACAEHREEADVEAFVQIWADGFRRCGGDPGPRFPLTEDAETVVGPKGPVKPHPRKRGCTVVVSFTITVLLAGGLATLRTPEYRLKTVLYEETRSQGSPTFIDPRTALLPDDHIPGQTRVAVKCRLYAPGFASADPDGWWYRIESSPWNGRYAAANTFMNGDTVDQNPQVKPTNTDFSVPVC